VDAGPFCLFQQEDDVNKYELVVIIDGHVADEEVPGAYERLVRQPIEARGGAIGEVDQWGRRKLAYPIQRQLEGNYSVTQFTMPPDGTKELERGLHISEEVLRHLLIRLDE
jgi:small subunit ribosomal protein S6